YLVCIPHARVPHDIALTVIGNPRAPGAIAVHVVYPDRGRAISQEDYVTLPRHLAAPLQAHADDGKWGTESVATRSYVIIAYGTFAISAEGTFGRMHMGCNSLDRSRGGIIRSNVGPRTFAGPRRSLSRTMSCPTGCTSLSSGGQPDTMRRSHAPLECWWWDCVAAMWRHSCTRRR